MAKKKARDAERRAQVERMRQEQARKEKRRSILILSGCLVGVGGLLAAALIPYLRDQSHDAGDASKAIRGIGVEAGQAGCNPIKTTPTDKTQEHVDPPTPIHYSDAPPAFGKHRPTPAPFGRPFYTTQHRPEVATLVHNLEHGYTIAWYDETAAKDSTAMDDLEEIAKAYEDDSGRFIAAPWTSADGAAFPGGKHIALTRWSADSDDPGDESKQRGNWQYCTSVSGSVIADFFTKWPNAESPEPGMRLD